MTTTIKKWGNSLAIRLPREIIRNLALREGSDVTIREENARIVIQKPLAETKRIGRDAWRQFVIPMKRRKENISGTVDKILYGSTR